MITIEKETLTSAIAEIRSLRRHNEILSAKVEMIDLFAQVLNTRAAERSHGGSPDIAWEIEKAISQSP